MAILARWIGVLTIGALSGVAGAQQDTPLLPPDPELAPMEAAGQAYRLGEERRLEALGRQRSLVAAAPYLSSAPAYAGRPAVPYLYSAPAYRPRRAFRPGAWLYPGAIALPAIPTDVYGGIPLPPEVRQPDGHVKFWTGPNGYIYRPTYRSPLFDGELPLPGPPLDEMPLDEPAPTLAPPANLAEPEVPPPPAPPAEPPAKPASAPPAMPEADDLPEPADLPEAIPAPLAEPDGPREF